MCSRTERAETKKLYIEGWYYKDENGKEQKWDFETPVHADISLKAAWKKDAGEVNGTAQKENNKIKKKKQEIIRRKERKYWKIIKMEK